MSHLKPIKLELYRLKQKRQKSRNPHVSKISASVKD